MFKRRNLILLSGLPAAALIAWACDRPAPPAAPELGSPEFHLVGCPSKKFTGGGRIDPLDNTLTGKVTFGFNVHADDQCNVTKGQIQVVHHPTQTKYHTIAFTRFATGPSPEGGECMEVNGTMRVKHGNGDWHEHDFFIQACDNGEPGSSPGTGPDTFWFSISNDGAAGHGNTGRTELTGGNIQAH